MALRDQEDAGIDVVSEGEMRRVGFFTAEFYRHLTRPRAAAARAGASVPAATTSSTDSGCWSRSAAPDGLGVVAEFRVCADPHDAADQGHDPGPVHALGPADVRARPGLPGPHRRGSRVRAHPRRRARGLVAAGATYIQVDEPSPAIHPEASGEFAALFNAAAAGGRGSRLAGGAPVLRQLLGRPLARRVYRPVLEQALAFRVDELVLEWANREMTELDVAADIAAAGRHLSAGVVDVKSYHIEIGRGGRRADRDGA